MAVPKIKINAGIPKAQLVKLQKRIREIKKSHPEAVAAGVYQSGVDIISRSVPLVPIDTRAMRSTRFATPMRNENDTMTIGYGTDYARSAHKSGPRSGGVGSAKFLERPFRSIARMWARHVARRAARFAKQGVGLEGARGLLPERPVVGGAEGLLKRRLSTRGRRKSTKGGRRRRRRGRRR